MVDLRDNMCLYEVKEFKLVTRDKKLLTIQILKDVTGNAPKKYIAKPTSSLNDLNQPKKEFYGTGESEETALQECIDKILDKDIKEILNLNAPIKSKNESNAID